MMKFIMMIIFLTLSIMYFNKMLLMFMNSIMSMLMSLIYMYSVNFNDNWMNLYNWMGLDYISYIMVLLSFWIVSMMFMVSMKVSNKEYYIMLLLLLLLMLLLSFISMNYFMFYLFFEISLVPTFLLIMGWGNQPERINASMYMMMYTLFASLPLLYLVYYLNELFNSLSFMIILNMMLNSSSLDFMIYLYMILAFLVKLPVFMLHIWLPKAHVEAPLSGSMILAGVMLKLGGYGIMRSMLMMLNYSMKFNYLVMVVSLMGMFFLSLMCLRQYDLKMLVAYSSVVHMGMMLLGLMSLMMWGYLGGLIMMLAHGICSSALFILVNYLYERTKSRNLFMNKGMIMFMPTMSMWWFMFCICNMSAPISLNLFSELMIVMVLLSWTKMIIFILSISMYLSSMYSLYLFSYSQHGNYSNLLNKLFNNNNNEYVLMFMHWIPLNLLILKIDLLV